MIRIVIDTNVLVSGIFFGGFPGKILEAVNEEQIVACVTSEIAEEYSLVISAMIKRKQGKLNKSVVNIVLKKMEHIVSKTNVKVCRDPDDDKFLGCAKDAKAVYIVSGDKDLLVINNFDGIEIVTAKKFCEKYLYTKPLEY